MKKWGALVFGLIMVAGLAPGSWAVEPAEAHYYDEVTNRHLTVKAGDFGKAEVSVRFISGPGTFYSWVGDGVKQEKDLIFSQSVGEDQDRGTYFLAKGGESKLEINYKPGQRMPMDAGVNGLYRRITPDKRLSLAKKEFEAADDHLQAQFKTIAKTWSKDDKTAAADWKAHWPELRKKWVDIVYKAPASLTSPGKPALGTTVRPGAPTGVEGQADYWITMTEVTGVAIAFIIQPHDKPPPPDLTGDYDDGFGGRISLRPQKDGTLTLNLACIRGRGNETQTGMLAGLIPADKLPASGADELKADYINADPELPPTEKQAVLHLRRVGRFLYIVPENTARYTARGWFEGIYRWAPPVPQ